VKDALFLRVSVHVEVSLEARALARISRLLFLLSVGAYVLL
jgi:hypothetical protein